MFELPVKLRKLFPSEILALKFPQTTALTSDASQMFLFKSWFYLFIFPHPQEGVENI